MALPLQTPLQMPLRFTMTVKILQVSSKYWKQCSGTHPIDVYHPGLPRFSLFLQHLEQISSRLYKEEVRQLTTSCRFQASSRVFSLIALSSSSFHFCSSSSFTFRSCHFFLLHLWAAANLAWASSSICFCSAATSHCICSRSSSRSESTRITSGFRMMGTTVPVLIF